MLKTALFSTFILFSTLFVGCSSSNEKSQETNNAKANEILATNEIVLTDTQQNQYILKKTPQGYTLKSDPKKLLLLDIFATWCPPCRAEVPHLSSLAKKYKDDIVVLGVTIENGIENEKLDIFKKEYQANYPIANSSENEKLIEDVASKLNLGRDFGIPLLVLVKDGKIIHHFQGAVEEEFIESEIKKALGK
jgi:thiol-disulfide isomerase/thioredoxin